MVEMVHTSCVIGRNLRRLLISHVDCICMNKNIVALVIVVVDCVMSKCLEWNDDGLVKLKCSLFCMEHGRNIKGWADNIMSERMTHTHGMAVGWTADRYEQFLKRWFFLLNCLTCFMSLTI